MDNINENAKEVKVKARKPSTKKVALIAPAPLAAASLSAVGDSQRKMKAAPVAALLLDTVTLAELVDINSSVNKAHLSGKCKGGMLFLESENAIVVALDAHQNSTWISSKDGSIKAPTGTLKSVTGTIGDMRRRVKRVPIVAKDVTSYSYVSLTKADSVINDSSISAKAFGGIVTNDSGHIFMAAGSMPKDTWENLTEVSADAVPSGVLTPTTGILGDRPLSRKQTAVSFPLTIADSTDLAKADSPLNDTRISGKVKGAMFATTSKDIAIALGSKTTDGWVFVSNGSTVTPA